MDNSTTKGIFKNNSDLSGKQLGKVNIATEISPMIKESKKPEVQTEK
jgi:hypothetical protein